MTRIRLYFDADSMERAVITGLRARGIDATSALEVEMDDRSDEEQLKFARTEERVLFSFNVSDFQEIHTQYLLVGETHAGIVLAAQQRMLECWNVGMLECWNDGVVGWWSGGVVE